jgi:hypothetical protein
MNTGLRAISLEKMGISGPYKALPLCSYLYYNKFPIFPTVNQINEEGCGLNRCFRLEHLHGVVNRRGHGVVFFRKGGHQA